MENNQDNNLGSFIQVNNQEATEEVATPAQAAEAAFSDMLQDNRTVGAPGTAIIPEAAPAPTPQPVAPAPAPAPVQAAMPQPQQVAPMPGVPASSVPTAAPATGVGSDFATLLANTKPISPDELPAFEKIPAGTHYVKFNEFKLGTSKTGYPMVFIEFTIASGNNKGLRLSESFFLGNESFIGQMKHRLLQDLKLANIDWTQSLETIATFINGAAANLHLNVTISYKMDPKTGKESNYPKFDSVSIA